MAGRTAYGHHEVLERVKGVTVPLWLDALILRFIGLIHILLFLGGFMIAGMGVALSAGMAPSWTATAVILVGGSIMAACSTAVHGLRCKRPDLVIAALYGLVAVLAWVTAVAVVLYILVAQVDSPVARFVVCEWEQELADLPEELCSPAEVAEDQARGRPERQPDCAADAAFDISSFDMSTCQQKRVDDVHTKLQEVNSVALYMIFLLLVCFIVTKKTAKVWHHTNEEPDPFTRVVLLTLFGTVALLSALLVSLSFVWWEYSYTSAMFVVVSLCTLFVIGFIVFVLIASRKMLMPIANALLFILIIGLFVAYVFCGFFTGSLQSVSEMYHKHYDRIRSDFERVMPGVCNGLSELDCKQRMQAITLQKVDSAINYLMLLIFVVIVIVLVTWRAVEIFAAEIHAMHGLSQFPLETIQACVHLPREDILHATELYWEILHAPHRPCNEILLQAHAGTEHAGEAAGQLENTLRTNEKARLRSLSLKQLKEECVALGLDHVGPLPKLRERLLQAYSTGRMQGSAAETTDAFGVAQAKAHFFTVGEPELRMIPGLAWCPFLDRLMAVFSEDDGKEFLRFEEFLNMYSILSSHCPLEVKIRYAWCIYDLIGAGEIGSPVLKVILMHVLGLTEKDLSGVDDCEDQSETGEAEDSAQGEQELELSERVKGGRKVPQGAPAPPSRTTTPEPAPAGEASLDDLEDLDEVMMSMEPEPEEQPIVEPMSEPQPEPESIDLTTTAESQNHSKGSEEAKSLVALIWADLDIDGSGVLDDDELRIILRKVDPNMSDSNIQQAMLSFERDNSGGVNQTGFLRWWMQQDDDSRVAVGGADAAMTSPPGSAGPHTTIKNGSGSLLKSALRPQPAGKQQRKDRARRARLRQQALTQAEEKLRNYRKQNDEDVRALVELVMQEVDEDGDETMSFPEFRKSLLRSEVFEERFQLPYPHKDDVLPYPQAEMDDSGDEEVVLTEADHEKMLLFSAGHRRRKASIETDDAEARADANLATDMAVSDVERPRPVAPPPPQPGNGDDRPQMSQRKIINPMHAQDTAVSQDDTTVVASAQLQATQNAKATDSTRLGKVTKPRARRRQQRQAQRDKSKRMFEQFEKARAVRQHNNKHRNRRLGTLVEDGETQDEGNYHRGIISIYSQLVAQRQKEIAAETNRYANRHAKLVEREKRRRGHLVQPGSPRAASLLAKLGLDFDKTDVDSSLAMAAIRDIAKSASAIVLCVAKAIESTQKEDQLFFWRRSVQKVEGDFGGGVASVFTLKRWLFGINAQMLFVWMCFVIMPFIVLDNTVGDNNMRPRNISSHHAVNFPGRNTYGSGSGLLEDSPSLQLSELSVMADYASARCRSGFCWMYYSSYSANIGSYRMDFAYLATVCILFVINLTGIMRNIAHNIAIKFQNAVSDGNKFACSAELFGGYDFRASGSKIVHQNQKTMRNSLKTVLMSRRAAAHLAEQGLKGRLLRWAGWAASVGLAIGMGFAIFSVIQNVSQLQSIWWAPHPNVIITLIKLIIPKLIPVIVSFERFVFMPLLSIARVCDCSLPDCRWLCRRKDAADIMQNIVVRVFLCQMVSLGVMFKELLDLQSRTTSSGECFEDIAGELYIKSILSDFIATLLQYLWEAFQRKLLHYRLVNGGMRGELILNPHERLVLTRCCDITAGHVISLLGRDRRPQGVCSAAYSTRTDKTEASEIRVQGRCDRRDFTSIRECMVSRCSISRYYQSSRGRPLCFALAEPSDHMGGRNSIACHGFVRHHLYLGHVLSIQVVDEKLPPSKFTLVSSWATTA
jgi:Ca2+-binding EF-hand superfamily protein